MPAGDVYKLTLVAASGGTPITNVFHYRQTFGLSGGGVLADQFIEEIFPLIQDVVSNQTIFDRVEYLNYNDVADFGIDDAIQGETGERIGDTLPRFNAWSFFYQRTTRATRNGAKRFGVVSENDQTNGAADMDMLVILENTADGLSQFINLGGVDIWKPIIARISENGQEVLLENDVQAVQYRRLSTQNTRKPF